MASDNDQEKQGGEGAAFRQALRLRLRNERIAAREALLATEHESKSAAVLEYLYQHLSQRAPSLLAFYWPIRAEVDCRPLIQRLMALDWRSCLPVVVKRDAALAFRVWTPDSLMVPGEYGIPVVSIGEAVAPGVILLPVNAFDNAGYRLGYGGGYFDRTLASMHPRPYTIGVGFDLARVDSIRPCAHDVALDALATESEFTCFPI